MSDSKKEVNKANKKDGVLILDKPEGFTSFDAVAVIRRLTSEKKIGHTGTLDPMATGVLPILIGRAAKAADLILDTSKEYIADFRLGIKTDTGDITGKVTEEKSFDVLSERLEDVLKEFTGDIMQIPPMYSAVSVNGQRLYKLARQGIEIEREKREVYIEKLNLLEFDDKKGKGKLVIACSKGTYIRTLIEDISERLGTVGTMTALRRTKACGFSEEDSLTLDELKVLAENGELENAIRPVDSLFEDILKLSVTDAQAKRFQNGGALDLTRTKLKNPLNDESVRVYSSKDEFIGLGKINLAKSEVKVLKLFKLA